MLFTLGFTVGSCSDDDDAVLQAGYGYAQFKLYKSCLAETKVTRASTNELNYLRDAQKMKIVLINQEDGTEVVQTVGLEAMGDDSEFGLRSEKLQLMAGTYQIVGFYLFKADGTAQELKQILSGEPDEKTIITVINGGLAVQDIHVKVVKRGMVKFTVTKNFLPSTRAALGEDYLFSDIKYINVTVQEQFTKKDTTFSNVAVEYTEKLDNTINYMLKNGELKTTPYENDDLWEKIYEKLVRLSHLYTHKNLEISEEKDKLKELVSDISHQTKTPIANIKLYLEIMTDESDFKKNQEYIRKMKGQIDKLDFLLQSMVKMSRLETGTIKIQKQNVLLADTLAMAISNVVIKADKKNIKIDVQYDEQLMLKHDKKWTAEAIFNILDNAVKYTEVGGNIHVVVCRQELFTKISIEDTGKGIAPERQATIFTRFYREPEVHDKEGIGIGLYLAREIITLQNGYIEVQSQIGQGSKFIIYLPNRD